MVSKKEILKTQLLREAKKDLKEVEFDRFEFSFNLWLDADFRNRVLFPKKNEITIQDFV